MKDFLFPILTFLAGGVSGALWSHVQRPLTDYIETVSKISGQIIVNILLTYTNPLTTDAEKAESRKLYDSLRTLHAQLLSSSSMIPRFARPTLRLFGLLRSEEQIEKGAQMLVGILNQVTKTDKDLPHLTECIRRLGTALDIAVSR